MIGQSIDRIWGRMRRLPAFSAILGLAVFCSSFGGFAIQSAGAAGLESTRDQCFTRIYSAGHLAKNPRQQTLAMRFVHRPSAYSAEERALSEGQGGRIAEQIAWLEVLQKQAFGPVSQLVVCQASSMPERFTCGVECDGGRFQLRLKANGSVLLDFRQRGGITLSGACDGGGKPILFGNGKDDQLFRLDVSAMSACNGLP